MTEFTYKLAREMFLARDTTAVSDFNNWMLGDYPKIEDRLAFLEGRLNDLCNVVMRTLIELDKDLPRS